MTNTEQRPSRDESRIEKRNEEHLYVEAGTRPMSHKLLTALEEVTGIDTTSSYPLGYVIDLDAIDALYATHSEETAGRVPVVNFVYQGHEITIESSQEIRINRNEDYD